MTASTTNSTSDKCLEALLPSQTPSAKELKRQILMLNNDPNLVSSILLRGDTGVGKTYLARILAIHRCWVEFQKTRETPSKKYSTPDAEDKAAEWSRKGYDSILRDFGEPYDSINLSNFEGPTLETELFGYLKGAFTDAREDHAGILAKPNTRDVLIDEIGYAEISTQRKLLELVQDRTFSRRNETTKQRCTKRLIFATNQPLEELVAEKKIQEDFYFRLNSGAVLRIPPLHERVLELSAIAGVILAKLKALLPNLDPRRERNLTDEDLNWARSYPWPGNIRQLEAALRIWLLNIAWSPGFTLAEANIPIEEVFSRAPRKDPQLLELSSIKAYFARRLAQAHAGNKIKSFEDELALFLEPIRQIATKALVQCIDEQSLTRHRDELANLLDPVNGVSPKTAAEWASEKRALLKKPI